MAGKHSLLLRVEGFAPAGLVKELEHARWEPKSVPADSRNFMNFLAISLGGFHLLRPANRDVAKCRFCVVVTDNTTGEEFETDGFSSKYLPNILNEDQLVAGRIKILEHELQKSGGEGLTKYTIKLHAA